MGGNRGLAEHIRTGLGENPPSKIELRLVKGGSKTDPLEEIFYGKTVRQQIREFGCVIGFVALAICGYKLLHVPSSLGALAWGIGGVVFPILCYVSPLLMRGPWRLWMKFGHFLGEITNVIVVGIAWGAMFVPIGVLFRLVGKKVMDTSFKAPVDSYWEIRPEKSNDFKLLERQF